MKNCVKEAAMKKLLFCQSRSDLAIIKIVHYIKKFIACFDGQCTQI